MKFIKILIICLLLLILWIFKPIIMIYFTVDDTQVVHSDYKTYTDNTISDDTLEYHSSYEKKLYKHKSSKSSIEIEHKSNTSSQLFRCDGREHCSQMHSYEEAKYFITHCPNTKMDGDHDGIPCERQFGRYD